MFDIRLIYLLFFGTVATSLSYQTLFLQQRGLSDSEIGLVQTAQGLAVFFVPLISGHFSDRHASSRISLVTCLVALSASHLLMLLAEGSAMLIVSGFVQSLCYSPVFSLLDSTVLQLMAKEKHARSFTYWRIWGSIGFLLPALILFPFLRGPNASMEWTVCYGAFASAIAAVAAWITIPRGSFVSPQAGMLPSVGAFKALFQPKLRLFSLVRFLTQVSIWIWYPFFPLYLKQLGYESSWIGPIINIGVLAEIVWALGMRRLDSSGGRLLSIIAAGSVALRMLLLTALPGTAVIILAQLLHAPYIWAMFFRGTVYTASHVEERYRTSFLALCGILFHGVARAIGGPIGGLVSDHAVAFGVEGPIAALFLGGTVSLAAMTIAILLMEKE